MLEGICNKLVLIYDPEIVLNMQSANGEIDQSLGLARNIPFLIGDITLYLQVHIIRNPAYDVLLSRPFDILTESIIKNYLNEDQTITIINMPVVEHKPWVQCNIPILPGIYDEVCRLIKTKIAAGVYEPSNSSYRSHWFTVIKKTNSTSTGTKLRIVHSLEPLNAVTIQHSGVPPYTNQIAEQFAACACGGILDLYVGYDKRGLAESSRNFTTFQTPFGAHRLPEIPDTTIPFIDDVPIQGLLAQYELLNGGFETHPDNSGIQRGGTFSGHKATLCSAEITVVGHRCTYKGRLPNESRVESIMKWGPCRDLSDVRAFLGTIGVIRIFIRNFAHRAHALTMLMCKDFPFVFGPDQIAAQDDLRSALLKPPALRPINYGSAANVILAVDTSQIAVSFHLCQCALNNPQPKLELYESDRVDACYTKGMLTNPDLEPSASINRWIVSILTFHFTLVHIPGTSHGPNGLSRRPPQPADQPEPKDNFDN
ncbi:hypothetical protein HETIRDRAFT_455118 [Heterobasidion irregulare TC 32-1]|uniref:Reverse transcriptase/retrotransposon-derived protein RNase H-like domain-containing protein n=1 Tax=Heterobasidion irregulare (strain TC 32-1) TaxID=747525 RepID=W4JSS6_HETIT|nr:uncharacterized protein HETIRDRAFT_455118 [Heterobasidion irregulare TC 32-1]ETW76593.1 hypothetical protein HETIRDRAFT_455118 [Heterobasidion irregulare TC 32-1]